jgi:hypothetical protein
MPRRLIKLTDPGAPVVNPLEDDVASPRFEPFRFPPLNVSLDCWLVGLAEFFYGKYQRGITAVLMIHPGERRWVEPFLPRQQCGVDGASFQLLPADFQSLGGLRIGGSFQAGTTVYAENARALVPEFDGLHIVYGQQEVIRRRHFFLRVDSQIHQVLPEDVLVDDWREFLHFHQHRLTLA